MLLHRGSKNGILKRLLLVKILKIYSVARTGNPNHENIPDWPQYQNNRATMIFGKDIEVIDDPNDKERAVWDDVIILKN